MHLKRLEYMKKLAVCVGLTFVLSAAGSALAQSDVHAASREAAVAEIPLADCPLAGRGLSIDSPLFDLLTNTKAKKAIQRLAPELLASLPPPLSGTTLPSISSILPLRFLMADAGKENAAEIDRTLRAISITADDDRRRCARYDGAPPPPLPPNLKHPAILVFDKSNGFRDVPSVDAAAAALRSMASAEGWQLVFTDRAASFNSRDLARFDAVVWNNVSGDVLSLNQRSAFEDYIEHGGGFVGIHGSGGDPLTYWDWYVDELVGARFKGHPHQPQFQSGRLVVDDSGSGIVAGLGSGWTMTEEWYSFTANPRSLGAHVLITLDEGSYKPLGFAGDLRMGDHPIAWTRCVGAGRSFYTAIGHLPESYTQPSASRLLKQGIAWAAGFDASGCRNAQP